MKKNCFLTAIVVVDEKWGIAKNGGLLTHLSGDLKYFKEKTRGNIVIMGRKTLESLPNGKPLSERTNIILTTSSKEIDGCIICKNHDEVFEKLKSIKENKECFIVGGEKVYKEMIKYCSKIFVTKIKEDFQADQHFENLDRTTEFKCVWESEENIENEVRYTFTEYRRM